MTNGFSDTDTVRVVADGHVSRIEPALDASWPDLAKLRWHAAVVNTKTGLSIRVDVAEFRVDGFRRSGYFDICLVPWQSSGPHDFHSAWYLLCGIHLGAAAKVAEAQAGGGQHADPS